LGGLAPVARDGGGGKGVTQATAERRNPNFKPHWKLAATLALAFVGAAARRFEESAMLETPILDVVTVLVIAAVLWSIFR
jgi:hypothetical protein